MQSHVRQTGDRKINISGHALAALLRLLNGLPFSAVQGIGALLGRANWWLSSRMANVTLENLQRCFPAWSPEKRDSVARASLIETGKVAAETGWIWHSSQSELQNLVRCVTGEDIIRQAQQFNKGVILLAPHFGNWELLNCYLGKRYPFTCLYNQPIQKGLARLIKKCRQQTGSRLVEAGTSGVRTLYRALRRGEMIGILPDQVPVLGGWVKTPFFGVSAVTMTLPCRLAAKTNAIVVMGVARRLSAARGFELSFQEIDLPRGEGCVNAMNRCIEDLIETDVAQYQWEYKRFKVPRQLSLRLNGARRPVSVEPAT